MRPRLFVRCLTLMLLTGLPGVPLAAQEPAAPEKPLLRIETGMHLGCINQVSADARDRYLATASDDKTVRVWDAVTGALLSVLRPPIGEGDRGKMYAVALSPDGSTIACGGWTGPPDGEMNEDSIYLFRRDTGRLF